jgi:hypothetical protein
VIARPHGDAEFTPLETCSAKSDPVRCHRQNRADARPRTTARPPRWTD